MLPDYVDFPPLSHLESAGSYFVVCITRKQKPFKFVPVSKNWLLSVISHTPVAIILMEFFSYRQLLWS